MSKHGTIRRYALIIEKVRRKLHPSFRDIRDYLFDHGFEVSDRTLQRDIEQIRCEFGVEITYHRIHQGYYIDQEKSPNFDNFLRFLELANTAELLTESLKESHNSLEYISFESQGDLRGCEYLKPLLFAVRNHRVVSFVYEKFKSSSPRRRMVEPYLLKEYQKRWYLVGISGSIKEFRIYGIDRIENLKVLDRTFSPDPGTDPRDLFLHTVGLTYTEGDPQFVELSFTPLQGKYVKSLPLHHSQEIIRDNADELRVKLFVNPNFEFRQRILMLGDAVKVIKPQGLANEIQAALNAALARYA